MIEKGYIISLFFWYNVPILFHDYALTLQVILQMLMILDITF